MGHEEKSGPRDGSSKVKPSNTYNTFSNEVYNRKWRRMYSTNKVEERDRSITKDREPGRTRSKILAYLELVRPHNVVAAVLCVILGVLAASKVVGRAPGLVDIVVPATVVALISAGGYAINDYFDYKVDSVNKPYRPLPSGRVSLKEDLALSIILAVVGILISTWFGLISLIYVVLNSLLVYGYSAKIKEWGFVGNLVVSLEGSASIFYGSLVVYLRTGSSAALTSATVPMVIAFVLLLGREVVKTIEDYYADSVREVKSLPRLLGLKTSSTIASAILLTVPVLAVLPALTGYYNIVIYVPLATITVAIVVVSAIRLLRSSNVVSVAIKERSSLKAAIVIGILALLLSLL